MTESPLPDGGTVRCEVEKRANGPVAHLIIDHKERRNALGPAVVSALTEQALKLHADPDLRLVTLRGTEAMFSAGANVKVLANLDENGARGFITSLHKAIDAVRRIPVPVIAVLEGRCYGGAMELAAACDMRLAAASLVTGMPEVRVGIPSVIEACLLPRLIGWGKTSELLFTGRDVVGDENLEIGFVERLVPNADVENALEDWIEMILTCAPGAIRAQKRIMHGWEPDDAPGIDASINAFARSYAGDEPARYLAPLVKKRA
ncbi:MAG: enoyl-CoA hydratase-related protein [Pseudomonadota bacterium]